MAGERPKPGQWVRIVAGPSTGATGSVVYIPRGHVVVEREERGGRAFSVEPIKNLWWYGKEEIDD